MLEYKDIYADIANEIVYKVIHNNNYNQIKPEDIKKEIHKLIFEEEQ